MPALPPPAPAEDSIAEWNLFLVLEEVASQTARRLLGSGVLAVYKSFLAKHRKRRILCGYLSNAGGLEMSCEEEPYPNDEGSPPPEVHLGQSRVSVDVVPARGKREDWHAAWASALPRQPLLIVAMYLQAPN